MFHVRAYAAYDMLENLEMPQNVTYSFPVLFSFQIDHLLFSRNVSIFLILRIRCGKMGHFVKKARDRFEMGKEPKMNMYHFGAFPDFRASHMLHRPSPAKYILQMLFFY